MTAGTAHDELAWATPPGWADAVLGDELALLSDHAHLEQSAASNALALVRRWPEGAEPDRWVARLASIARDEVEHLALVSRTLARRGGTLPRSHRNTYAGALRRHVAEGTPHELADRLHVSALIELRSHERFRMLGAAGHELSPLWAGLEASEAGHHRVFVHLAAQAGGTEERWRGWCDLEAQVAAAEPFGHRVHAGPPAAAA